MRQRDVRTSAARPVRGRMRLGVVRSASGWPTRTTAPATTPAGASASTTGGSGVWAVVRMTASDAHSWAPCGACGLWGARGACGACVCNVCGVCGSTPSGATVGAVTAAGSGPCASSVSACVTAHRTITSSRAPWTRQTSRRGHGEPDEVHRRCDGIRKRGGTGPPCDRLSSGRKGRKAAGMGGGKGRHRRAGPGSTSRPDTRSWSRRTSHRPSRSRVRPAWTAAVAKGPGGRTLPVATPAGPRRLSWPRPTPCGARHPDPASELNALK